MEIAMILISLATIANSISIILIERKRGGTSE